MPMRLRAYKHQGICFKPAPNNPMDMASSAFKALYESVHALLCGFASAARDGEKMSPAIYTKFVGLYVTPQMEDFLKVLAKRQKATLSDVVRQAIREYLDVQESLIGSRSRLGRTVMNELQTTQNRIGQQLNHMTALLLAAVVLQQLQRGEPGNRLMEQIVQLAGQIEQHLPKGEQ